MYANQDSVLNLVEEDIKKPRLSHKHCWALGALLVLLTAIGCLAAVIIYNRIFDSVHGESTETETLAGEDEVLKRLQALIGERPKITNHNFTNWGKTEFTHGVYLAEPESLQEIQRVINAAGSLKLRVRTVGTANSWAPLFADQGDVLIKTTSLRTNHDRPNMVINKPAYFGGDHSVTVMSGLTLGDVNEFLIANKLQLPVAPTSISASIGGIVGTASHGGNPTLGTISEYVVAMRVVDSSGQLRHFDVFENGDALRALQCCIGMCGVFYDITFKVEPLTIAKVIDLWPSTRDSIMNLDVLKELMRKYHSIHMHWAPISNVSDEQMAEYDRTGQMPSYSAENDLTWIHAIENPVFGQVPQKPYYLYQDESSSTTTESSESRTTSTTSTTSTTTATSTEQTTTTADTNTTKMAIWGPGLHYFRGVAAYTQNLLPANRPQYYYYPHAVSNVEESTIPVTVNFLAMIDDDANFTSTMKVMKAFNRRIEMWIRQGKVPINTVEIRFIGKSNGGCYICPGNFKGTEGHALTFNPVGSHFIPGFEDFVREFYEDLEKMFPVDQMRIQWSKMFPYMHDKNSRIRAAFGQQWHDFLRTRAKYKLDPTNMFVNRHIKELFFPSGN